MEPEIGVVQIFPQPRQPPKPVIWTIYSVISVGLIVTIAAVLSNQSDETSRKETPPETTTVLDEDTTTSQVSQETTTFIEEDVSVVPQRRVLLRPDSENKSRTGGRPHPNRLVTITLEEVVAYECYFEPGIKHVSWLENSDTQIVYRDGHLGDKAMIMNVTSARVYPASEHQVHYDDGRRALKTGNQEDRVTMTKLNADDDVFRQHVATTWNCYSDALRKDVECRYSIRILSSATDKGPTRSAVELFSTDSSQGQQRYAYVRRGPILHRRTYSLRPVGSDEISDNADLCTMTTLEKYELTWNSQRIQPKYALSISEACLTHRLSWTDEFTFDSVEHHRDVTLPTTFHLYPVTRESTTRRADKDDGKLDVPQHYQRTKLESIVQSAPASYPYKAPSIDRRRSAENNEATRCVPLIQQRGTTADSNSGAGDCEGEQRPQQRLRTWSNFVAETSAVERRHVQETTGGSAENDEVTVGGESGFRDKRKRVKTKYAFESARIGKTPWILHTIVHFSSLHNGSVLNMAISRSNTLGREFKSHGSRNWIPRASRRFKPLLGDDLYVTRILAAKLDSEDEATVYFVAAPVVNVSRRFLYKLKVVYPPLEYPTLEPVSCLTCPGKNNALSSNEADTRRYPRCIWSEVLMSHTAVNYILNCRAPKLPWTAIVSTRNNRMIRRLNAWSEFRDWHRSKFHPQHYEFELELGDGFRARVSLRVPLDWKNEFGVCKRKSKLLLRLADEQDGQLVNAQFDLSLTSYLTGVKGYAVVYADVRGSAFRSLDIAGLKFQSREAMQIDDYVRVVQLVAEKFNCVDSRIGFGVFGEAYGGHMSLNLVAGEDEAVSNAFSCGVAVKPFTAWQPYVYPFTMKSSSELVNALRKKLYRRQYLSPLTRRLRGRDFALFTGKSKRGARRHYEDNLLGLLARHNVQFKHRRYEDDCSSRLRMYEDLSAFFDRCFDRQYKINGL